MVREPFGKQAFAAMSESIKDARMEGTSELKVLGDWAYVRSHLTVTMTPPGGAPMRRAGYTLTIFRREPDGKWRLVRDANLLTGGA